jgi:acyl-coenzyme A synthetase/AMP-(fatty) acid ligase
VLTELGGLYTEQIEPVFNVHPDVRRSALVGVGEKGQQSPVLCLELQPGIKRDHHARIIAEVQKLGLGFVHTARIECFLVHPKFPVDIRHNAKIGREILALWAAKRLGS